MDKFKQNSKFLTINEVMKNVSNKMYVEICYLNSYFKHFFIRWPVLNIFDNFTRKICVGHKT